jgi:hypothetical protein
VSSTECTECILCVCCGCRSRCHHRLCLSWGYRVSVYKLMDSCQCGTACEAAHDDLLVMLLTLCPFRLLQGLAAAQPSGRRRPPGSRCQLVRAALQQWTPTSHSSSSR